MPFPKVKSHELASCSQRVPINPRRFKSEVQQCGIDGTAE